MNERFKGFIARANLFTREIVLLDHASRDMPRVSATFGKLRGAVYDNRCHLHRKDMQTASRDIDPGGASTRVIHALER